ncbi:diaminopimelate epimerase [Formosa sediminum]|uniref:Diaminopimelate epimerase n=1 Tax=Formosa sediminum TaxID=2594004 RepID=A0A516GLU7_9FLAO|nr:diaminopimelate epimerase [Formosa sediminum]QDO92445.1 diaminopimelate epimerase [Formosa sediminum]
MTHTFYKYQGTGNDFVMIDNRQNTFNKQDTALINRLCDRRFGIGADGLILLENHPDVDFKMVYYNADGNESTMCGNGGRCLSQFAKDLKVIDKKASFEAIDGMHHVVFDGDLIQLQMQDVPTVEDHGTYVFLNTGSPHHVQFEDHIESFDIKALGSTIRYGAPYYKEGTNVNFVKKISSDAFEVRTYERGVEDETLSCGTGVTAVAIAMNYLGETPENTVHLKVKGGELKVSFTKTEQGYTNVWLIGPAKQVFKGEIEW